MAFGGQITTGLEADIPEGDTDALERSLTFIHEVRTRHAATIASFAPLHAMVTLLKRHGISLSEAELKMLDDAPVRWEFTVDKVYKVSGAVLAAVVVVVGRCPAPTWSSPPALRSKRRSRRSRTEACTASI